MLLNLWAAERCSERSRRRAASPERQSRPSTVTALAAVGFEAYAHALRSKSLKALTAAEVCKDALGLERIPQIDGLLAALAVRPPGPCEEVSYCPA
jgi:hypothetical protein